MLNGGFAPGEGSREVKPSTDHDDLVLPTGSRSRVHGAHPTQIWRFVSQYRL